MVVATIMTQPTLSLQKNEYVSSLQSFAKAISPKNDLDTMKFLEAIVKGDLKDKKLTDVSIEGVSYFKVYAIQQRLLDLGIITRQNTFSEVFQRKLTAISKFYGELTGKMSSLQASNE
jgi:hypothetical protein